MIIKNNNNLFGITAIIVGTILFVVFAGKFAIQLIVAILAIFLINIGLQSLRLPKLQDFLFYFLNQIKNIFKK